MQVPVRRWLSRILTLLRTPEMRFVAPLALVTGLLFIFVKLAEEVFEGETHSFDTALLLAFRTTDPADPIGPLWLEVVMSDLTALGGFPVLVLVCTFAATYLLIRRKIASALLVIGSGLGGVLLNHVLKIGFDRPRPDIVAHLAEVHTLSFPSGHAMLSAIIYLTLGALLARAQKSRRLKAYSLGVALILTLLVGLSRIYLGVHWPTDVLAGWCIGGAWAVLCLQIIDWHARQPKLVKPSQGAVSHK